MIWLAAIPYMAAAVFFSRLLYRGIDWDNGYNSDQEHRVYAAMWSLAWPISGLFLLAQFVMVQPGRAERAAARQEAQRHHIRERAAALDIAEQELQEINAELRRKGINV